MLIIQWGLIGDVKQSYIQQSLIKATGSSFSSGPIVHHHDAYYVIGGESFTDDGDWGIYTESNIIGRFDTLTSSWSESGVLKTARVGPSAIVNGDNIIVAGGWGSTGKTMYKTEVCKLNNNTVACVEQAPLTNYYLPQLYLVNDSFCET